MVPNIRKSEGTAISDKYKHMDNIIGKKSPVLMKSKHRVQKHGEVFTPQWVIDKMIAIPGIKEKTEDVFATFLEPSAGEGAFLLAIEDMKLRFITDNYSKDTWDCYALWALSSIYGIEFLEDNLDIARQNMLNLFSNYYKAAKRARLSKKSNLYKSARTIVWANVVQGDAITHKNLYSEEIIFSHWERIPEDFSKAKRIPFVYSSILTGDKNEDDSRPINMFRKAEQTDLFKVIDNNEEEEMQSQRYLIVDIVQVWKEEKENVR